MKRFRRLLLKVALSGVKVNDMKIYVETQKGKGKAVSDDRVLVHRNILSETALVLEEKTGFVAIADGVGGNAAGDVAAVMACAGASAMEVIDEQHFEEINQEILERGAKNKYKGMAATFSGIHWGADGSAVCCHVGNTRIYAIQGSGYLKQLTEDDTVVQFLLKTGKLTEEEAENYTARNEITACFGGGKAALLNIKLFPVTEDEHTNFLMTSDGIHEYLTIDEMEDCISESEEDGRKLVQMLVKKAQEKGSTDDCTAVYIDRGNT